MTLYSRRTGIILWPGACMKFFTLNRLSSQTWCRTFEYHHVYLPTAWIEFNNSPHMKPLRLVSIHFTFHSSVCHHDEDTLRHMFKGTAHDHGVTVLHVTVRYMSTAAVLSADFSSSVRPTAWEERAAIYHTTITLRHGTMFYTFIKDF